MHLLVHALARSVRRVAEGACQNALRVEEDELNDALFRGYWIDRRSNPFTLRAHVKYTPLPGLLLTF